MTYVLGLEENLSRLEESHRRTPNSHAIVMMKLMLRIIILIMTVILIQTIVIISIYSCSF